MYGSTTKREVLMYVLCPLYEHNSDGLFRKLCYLENYIMKRKQLSVLASRSLRIYTYGKRRVLHKHCRLPYRFDSVSWIFPIYRHKAATADDTPEYGDLKVFRFGYKGHRPFPKNIPCDDWIKIRAVVRDKEQICIGRQLVSAADLNADANDFECHCRSTIQNGTVKAVVLFIILVWIYQQRTDPIERNGQNGSRKQNQKNIPHYQCDNLPSSGADAGIEQYIRIQYDTFSMNGKCLNGCNAHVDAEENQIGCSVAEQNH